MAWCQIKCRDFAYEFPTFLFHSHSRIPRYITNTLEMLSKKPNKLKSIYTLNEQQTIIFVFYVCVYVCAVIYYRIYWFSVTQNLACSKSITSPYVGKNVDILFPNQTSRDLHPKHKAA